MLLVFAWCLERQGSKKDKEASSMIVVVSPLIADQVHKKGMKAIHVSGDLDETVISDIYEGKFQVQCGVIWRDMA